MVYVAVTYFVRTSYIIKEREFWTRTPELS